MGLDKGMEGVQLLTYLTGQLNGNYQSEPLSSISSFLTFILSCLICLSHTQAARIYLHSVSLPASHAHLHMHIKTQVHKSI